VFCAFLSWRDWRENFLIGSLIFLGQWLLSVGHMAPRGPHQVSNGPQENDGKLVCRSNFCLGHRNFTAWMESFVFKIESKVPFSPAPPQAQKANWYFIAFPTSGWMWFLLGVLYAVKSTLMPWCKEICSSLITDHTATGHSYTWECQQAEGTHWT
jgi:hypothetical protein